MTVYAYTPYYNTRLHEVISTSVKLAPHTQQHYLQAIDRFCLYAGVNPENWTPITIDNFYKNLLDGKIKAQTANRIFNAVRYAFRRRAAMEGLGVASPAEVIEMRGDGKAKMKEALSEELIQHLLLTCRGPRPYTAANLRDTVLLIVGLETGLRRNGLASMYWSKIQNKNSPAVKHSQAVIDVPVKGDHGLARYDVPLSYTAQQALAAWRRWCERHHQMADPIFRRVIDKDGTVTLGETALTDQAVYDIVKKRAAAAQIDSNVSPHVLRFTLLSWRSNAGVANQAIKAVTGHEDDIIDKYNDKILLAQSCLAATPGWLRSFAEELNH